MTTQEMRVHLSAHDNLHVKTRNQHLQNSNLNHSESKNLLCTDENRQHTTLVLDRPPKTKEQKQAPPGGLVHREIGLNGQETSRRSVGTWNIDRPSATQRATSTCVRSNELCPAAPNMTPFPGLSRASARRPIRVTHPCCELKVVTHGKTLWKNACPTTLHFSPVRSPDDDHLSKISVNADDKHLRIPRVTPNMATNHEHLPIHHDRGNVCCKEDVRTTNYRQLVQKKKRLNSQRAAI